MCRTKLYDERHFISVSFSHRFTLFVWLHHNYYVHQPNVPPLVVGVLFFHSLRSFLSLLSFSKCFHMLFVKFIRWNLHTRYKSIFSNKHWFSYYFVSLRTGLSVWDSSFERVYDQRPRECRCVRNRSEAREQFSCWFCQWTKRWQNLFAHTRRKYCARYARYVSIFCSRL